MTSFRTEHCPSNISQVANRIQNYCDEISGTRWGSWLRHCVTGRRVVGSIPDGVLKFFLELILPVSTQYLTEVSARDISWRVKAAGAVGLTTIPT